MSEYRSLYMLADSQLLFRDVSNNEFINSVQKSLQAHQATVTEAAYIGASNNDNEDFYELFVAAMGNINTNRCRMIRADVSDEDRDYLKSADLILLAGGDVARGWRVIKEQGLDSIITDRYFEGAVTIGVSAGAVQLGMGYLDENNQIVDTLRLCPHYIYAHDEKRDWATLAKTVRTAGDYSRGYGIYTGGGLIYRQDSVIDILHQPICEMFNSDDGLGRNILLPDTQKQ